MRTNVPTGAWLRKAKMCTAATVALLVVMPLSASGFDDVIPARDAITWQAQSGEAIFSMWQEHHPGTDSPPNGVGLQYSEGLLWCPGVGPGIGQRFAGLARRTDRSEEMACLLLR